MPVVDVLLDTGALWINKSYISLDIVNQSELEHKLQPPVAKNKSICSGLDGTCFKNPKSVTLNVYLTKNVKLQFKCFILSPAPFHFIIGETRLNNIA